MDFILSRRFWGNLTSNCSLSVRKSKYDGDTVSYWVETEETGEYERSFEEVDQESKYGPVGDWKQDKAELPSDEITDKKKAAMEHIDAPTKPVYVASW